jgi:hypothetical protein
MVPNTPLKSALIGAFVLVLLCTPSCADFRDDMARLFNSDPAYLVLNIPPRPGGWPGSIYSNDMRFSIVRGDPKDPTLARGPEYDFNQAVEIDLSSGIGAKIATLFGLSVDVANITKTELKIFHARTYELTLSQVKEKLARLKPEQRRPPGPVVVYRAYEGIFAISLTRNGSASADAWGKLKSALVKAGASASASAADTLSVEGKERIIFAFEVARTNDVSALERGTTAAGCYGACGADKRVSVTTTGASPAFGKASNVGTVLEWGEGKASTSYGLERIPAAVFESANRR